MTLLDAPKFDEVRARRNKRLAFGGAGTVLVLIVACWLVAGRPIDWPWHWNAHLLGRMAVNRFFVDLEKSDLQDAYGVWVHDKNWQQHPHAHFYTFERFQQDWAPDGHQNDFGPIRSHRIAASRLHGNVLMLGIFVNDRKSGAINLDYDPSDRTLSFSPDNVQFFEGPGGIH
jgi:hypothetical protein